MESLIEKNYVNQILKFYRLEFEGIGMINGTLVNYYLHCKRQCWLHGNRVNLEDNSMDVKVGKALHEIKAEGKSDSELAIENIKLDKLTKDYLVEIKKSDADIDAVTWQVLYYLKVLKGKGIERKGKIEFVEKNKTENKIVYVEYTQEAEKILEEIEQCIEELLKAELPEKKAKISTCKKCAYYEYCYI